MCVITQLALYCMQIDIFVSSSNVILLILYNYYIYVELLVSYLVLPAVLRS